MNFPENSVVTVLLWISRIPLKFTHKCFASITHATSSEEEFKRSEKGIRYQIIESKIINENKLELNSEELKKFAANMVKNQMFQYGQIPEEKQVEGIVSNILSKKDELKRISDQLMSQKLLNFYKEKAPLKLKKISFDKFIEEAYGKSK